MDTERNDEQAGRPAQGMRQASLFEPGIADLPMGLRYEAGFLSAEEESHWLSLAQALPIEPMRYKQYTARRRVFSFGGRYDFDDQSLAPSPALPEAWWPLRRKVAQWAGLAETELAHMLIAEYSVGTPLGWHRDVPDFEDVVGVSLLNDAVMKLRPCSPPAASRRDVLKLVLAPGSVYRLSGPARWQWQHSIAPTTALRYSITFRTPRRVPGRP